MRARFIPSLALLARSVHRICMDSRLLARLFARFVGSVCAFVRACCRECLRVCSRGLLWFVATVCAFVRAVCREEVCVRPVLCVFRRLLCSGWLEVARNSVRNTEKQPKKGPILPYLPHFSVLSRALLTLSHVLQRHSQRNLAQGIAGPNLFRAA